MHHNQLISLHNTDRKFCNRNCRQRAKVSYKNCKQHSTHYHKKDITRRSWSSVLNLCHINLVLRITGDRLPPFCRLDQSESPLCSGQIQHNKRHSLFIDLQHAVVHLSSLYSQMRTIQPLYVTTSSGSCDKLQRQHSIQTRF